MEPPDSMAAPRQTRLFARAKHRGCAILSGRLFPLWVALLAAVLTLSSLKAGFFADDYHHRVMLMESETPNGVSRSPMDIFTFMDGNPGHAAEMIDYGILPWWTWKESKVAFFRPLASLTHWIDYSFWPDSPVPMHLQSVLWYAGLVASVALLYRRFFTVAWVAGLAALLYAVDDAHGPTVAWLANRNALMAALFGVLALLVHGQWRRGRLWAGMVAGPALLVMHSPAIWMCNNQPIPRRIRILTSSLFRPVTIQRSDERTLIVRPAYGFHVHIFDRLFRDRQHPFSAGDRIVLTGMTIEIRQVNADGQATEAAFIFSTPLEEASLRWIQHKDGAFIPFVPPPVGQTVVLPGFEPFMPETSKRGRKLQVLCLWLGPSCSG